MCVLTTFLVGEIVHYHFARDPYELKNLPGQNVEGTGISHHGDSKHLV